ncbi:glycosyltransferase [Gynurincola endophyticus]|uniref:glycosyltransferase n=1 Tax=Gynurincola endophyticus TaxID=2479004 RepID=UPI000F8CE693|nr:glycosyltransferase [Gynurincola endophyticus]
MNQPIKILETIRQGQIGGGESHLLSLVENLDRSVYEPVVLSHTEGPMVDQLKAAGIKTYVIPTTKPFDMGVWKKVQHLIKSENIRLVHAHGTRAFSNCFWAAKQLKLPVVYTIHGWSFHDDQNFLVKKIRTYSEGFLTRQANVNISVSASNQATGKNAIKGFNSIVINNGINQDKYNPRNSYPDLRKEWGIPDDHVVVLFVARFIHQKQPWQLIKSFALALKKHPKMRLVMVGDGDQKPKALEIVKELGIQEAVVFQSFRQDVPAVLANADIFVLPSLWEGLPIALLEAMAMGKAVIGTYVDGTKEVLQDQQNGVLVSMNNIDSTLADAIVDLAQHPQKRSGLGNRAIQTISDTYSAATMTRQVENIYRGLII